MGTWIEFVSCCCLKIIRILIMLNWFIVLFRPIISYPSDFPGGSDGKAPCLQCGDLGSVPGLGRSSGEGNGTPLQYSCLENPMDGKPDRLQSMGSQRAGHDWATSLSLSPERSYHKETYIIHINPVFLKIWPYSGVCYLLISYSGIVFGKCFRPC